MYSYHNINYRTVCSGMLATLFDVGGVSEAAGYSNYFRIEYFKAGSAVKPASIEAIKYVSVFFG